MEQTLTFEDSLVSRISRMTIFDQFAQTIFVEEKRGKIEIENSFREMDSIKFVNTEISYELKNHRVISKILHHSNILISDLMDVSTISVDKSVCKCVSSDLNKLFIQELGRFENIEEHKYNLYSQNIFNKLFYPHNMFGLINKFKEVGKEMSWAIIPYNLVNIFYGSGLLEASEEDNEKLIYNLGTIGHINIYVNPDDNSGKIYFGNFNSIIILANRYMNIFENPQGINYNFEYLFLEQGPIKSLQVI